MLQTHNIRNNKFILAIHSTNDHFGFGYRDLKNDNIGDKFSIKNLDKDLSKNLITNLAEFINKNKINYLIFILFIFECNNRINDILKKIYIKIL